MKIKVALMGPGGELDSVTLYDCDPEDDEKIGKAVADLISDHTWHCDDRLIIAEASDFRAFQ
jgi:hypothetical protein